MQSRSASRSSLTKLDTRAERTRACFGADTKFFQEALERISQLEHRADKQQQEIRALQQRLFLLENREKGNDNTVARQEQQQQQQSAGCAEASFCFYELPTQVRALEDHVMFEVRQMLLKL